MLYRIDINGQHQQIQTPNITFDVVSAYIKYLKKEISEISAIRFYNIATIAPNTFQSFSNLSSIQFFSDVDKIGDYAFKSTALQTVDLTKIKQFGTGIFKDCTNLTAAFLSTNTILSPELFDGCNNLIKLNRHDSVTSIGKNALANTALTSYSFYNCEKIDNSAFKACTELTNITNTKNIKNIGDYAFASCYNFPDKISLPACTEIGRYAFLSCQNLSNLNAPQCTFVDYNAFYGTKLWDVDPQQ